MKLRRKKTAKQRAAEIDISLGSRIRHFRGDKPQKEVADFTGRTVSQISRVELGTTTADPALLLLLAKCFGIAVQELFDGIRA